MNSGDGESSVAEASTATVNAVHCQGLYRFSSNTAPVFNSLVYAGNAAVVLVYLTSNGLQLAQFEEVDNCTGVYHQQFPIVLLPAIALAGVGVGTVYAAIRIIQLFRSTNISLHGVVDKIFTVLNPAMLPFKLNQYIQLSIYGYAQIRLNVKQLQIMASCSTGFAVLLLVLNIFSAKATEPVLPIYQQRRYLYALQRINSYLTAFLNGSVIPV